MEVRRDGGMDGGTEARTDGGTEVRRDGGTEGRRDGEALLKVARIPGYRDRRMCEPK